MKVVEMYRVKSGIKAVLPLFLARIAAGYPSPADDYIEECIDLNKKLITHPEATYLVRVIGDFMMNARIQTGDFVIGDHAVSARPGASRPLSPPERRRA